MLEQSASAENLNQKLTGYLKKYSKEDTDELALQPLTDIHLFSNLGHDLGNRGDIKYIWIFSALAAFVLLIAWPIAYFAMQAWLQKFAYRTNIEIWIFLLSAALGLTVALLTVSLQTLRAARANPVDSLKHE
jgi:hypothetical protein